MRRFALALLLLLAGASAAPAAHAQVASLPPVDEAATDPSFLSFRARLLTALAARDTAAVVSAFAPDAKLSFGGDGGRDQVRSYWLASDAPATETGDTLWATLAEALSLGSVVTGDGLVISPSLFGAFPDDLDAFSHVVVTGETVRVRSAPGTAGEVLGAVSYAVLPVRVGAWPAADGYRWAPVTLADGTPAFIADAFVRSPISYRTILSKESGAWQIITFVAGD